MSQVRAIEASVWPVKVVDESGVTDAVQVNLVADNGEGFVMTLTADAATTFGLSLIQASETHNIPMPED